MIPFKRQFIVLISLMLITACSKGPNSGIPAYIQIDSLRVNAKVGQGSSSQLISTLWIESEGENVGPYEMPVLAPVLVSGERQVILNAGVFMKGDYFNREIYPAYQPYKTTVVLNPAETVVINPVFEYYDETEFPLNEDFEDGNIFGVLNRTSLGDTNNIEGRALWIQLDNTNTLVRGVTSSPVDITPLKRVYIEMEYKGDVDFGLGIETLQGGVVGQSGYIDRIFASEDWYKIYYDISNLVNSLSAESFNFFIEVEKLENVDESNLYIDNFKIVVI